MKRRQELTIFGSQTAVEDALDALAIATVDAGWPPLDPFLMLDRADDPGERRGLFFWTPPQENQRGRGWVGFRPAGVELRLVLGIEHDEGPTIDEHNRLVAAAVKDLVVPAVDLAGAFFSLSLPNPSIEELLPRDVVRLLRRIASNPPPLGSAAMPASEPLFVELVVVSHAVQGGVTGELLQSWLVEDEWWAPDAALWVAVEFERILQRMFIR
jgi:hypothetical protein